MVNSFFVYFIILLSIIFALLSQRRKEELPLVTVENQRYQYTQFNRDYFVISYLLIVVLVALCASSHDYSTYVRFYETWTLTDVFSTKFEAGYVLLNVILHQVIKNGLIGTAIIKIISLTLVYVSLFKLKSRINIGFSVLAYDILLLMYNFQLLRMMLAVSVCFLAIAYEVTGKRRRALFLFILAFFFHYSSVVFAFTYLLYIFINREIGTFKTLCVFGVFIGLILSLGRILTYAIANFSFLSKYRSETAGFATVSTDIGMLQFVLFVPVLIILFSYFQQEKKSNFYALSFLIGIMTFVMGFVSYFYSILERGSYYFFCFFVFYCASIPLKKESRIQIRFNRISVPFPFICVLGYLGIYLILLLPGKLENAGLQQYVLIWNIL